MSIIGNPLLLGSSGGGGYTLLASAEFTVSTSSTTAASVGTMALGSTAYTSDKILYVKIRDKAGARGGYFLGTDNFFINPYPANGATTTLTAAAVLSITVNNYSRYNVYAQANGVFAYSIASDGTLTIYSDYHSTYSLRINGTYVVEAYLLDYLPNGNPFSYSY